MVYRIKNWGKFQHYKDKKSLAKIHWIKLYRSLLDDIEWFELDPWCAKGLVMLWLVASEQDGTLPPIKTLSFRLRLNEPEVKRLIDSLLHWVYKDSTQDLHESYKNSRPEERREEERREDTCHPKNGMTPELTFESLVTIWNEKAHPNLPRVKEKTEARRKKVRARLEERPLQSDWESVLNKINSSHFLTGQIDTNGRKPFVASFDWILEPKNLAKILEGNYDNIESKFPKKEAVEWDRMTPASKIK